MGMQSFWAELNGGQLPTDGAVLVAALKPYHVSVPLPPGPGSMWVYRLNGQPYTPKPVARTPPQPLQGPMTPEAVFAQRGAIVENITSTKLVVRGVPNTTRVDALADFNKMGVTDIKTIQTKNGEIIMGKLPDGDAIKLRPSNDGGRQRPIIEILNPTGRKISETRYGNPD